MFLSTWLFRFDKLSDEPKRFEAVFLFIFQVIWIMKTKIKPKKMDIALIRY